ncbi:hypothetical protein [Paraburkholderia sp.]|uniref:hypothetical protein n=1 Tax=Paraburkholderia sp. TaxID=1926495 RepID=UPI0025D8358B|nr:hypothetical protein [Paraburkholderia sp.]
MKKNHIALRLCGFSKSVVVLRSPRSARSKSRGYAYQPRIERHTSRAGRRLQFAALEIQPSVHEQEYADVGQHRQNPDYTNHQYLIKRQIKRFCQLPERQWNKHQNKGNNCIPVNHLAISIKVRRKHFQ